MSYRNDNHANEIGKLLGALCVIVALFGCLWFMAYQVYTTTPATETITVTLPPEMVVSSAGLGEPAQTIEIEQVKPYRDDFSALLHPFGFMALLLGIIGTGGGLIALAIISVRGQNG